MSVKSYFTRRFVTVGIQFIENKSKPVSNFMASAIVLCGVSF